MVAAEAAPAPDAKSRSSSLASPLPLPPEAVVAELVLQKIAALPTKSFLWAHYWNFPFARPVRASLVPAPATSGFQSSSLPPMRTLMAATHPSKSSRLEQKRASAHPADRKQKRAPVQRSRPYPPQ